MADRGFLMNDQAEPLGCTKPAIRRPYVFFVFVFVFFFRAGKERLIQLLDYSSAAP